MTSVTSSATSALELYQRHLKIVEEHHNTLFDLPSTFIGQQICNLSDIYAEISRREQEPPQLPPLMADYGMSLLHVAVSKSALTMASQLIQAEHPMDVVTSKTYPYAFLDRVIELPAGSTPFDYALKMNKLSFAIFFELNEGTSPLLQRGDETCKSCYAQVTKAISNTRTFFIKLNSDLPISCTNLIADYSVNIF